jgi:hypothetical protein
VRHIERCYVALHPELDSAIVPIEERVKVVPNNIETLIDLLGEGYVRWTICEIITNGAIPAKFVGKAENLLPEIVGGNVDHEVHMVEEESADYMHHKTPP